jgi:hypothetical protein
MPGQEKPMSNELKQLRLQLKERDAKISQLEAHAKHWKREYDELEAEVVKSLPIVKQAKEIVTTYTTTVTAITALMEKEN